MQEATQIAQGFDPSRLARVGARIEADVAAGKYHGAALRVSRRGQLVLNEIRGHADRAAGRKLVEDDVFVDVPLGSRAWKRAAGGTLPVPWHGRTWTVALPERLPDPTTSEG